MRMGCAYAVEVSEALVLFVASKFHPPAPGSACKNERLMRNNEQTVNGVTRQRNTSVILNYTEFPGNNHLGGAGANHDGLPQVFVAMHLLPQHSALGT